MADDYDYAPSDWWAQEEAFANQFTPLGESIGSSWNFTPDYSFSSGSGEGLKYTPTGPDTYALAAPSNQGAGLNVNDFAYVPGSGFEYTGGGGTGSGMSFGSTGSGIYAGMPTSVSATSAGAGSSGGASSGSSGLGSVLKSIPAAIKSGINTAGTSDWADLLKMMLVLNQLKEGKQIAGYKGGIDMNRKVVGGTAIPQQARSYGEGAQGQAYFTPTTYAAEGGVMGLAQGGQAKPPRYLEGATDGMADKIDTDIDGKQAAKLSHGEFVIPADVVSHMGNGNSAAGAKVLYDMMDRVRKARTGTKKQGKRINPEKFTPGGIAGYASGGAIAFAGETTSLVPSAPAVGASTESNLSTWAGPYVTDYLAKGKALADQPYQAYTGQLTAGTSPLQQQAMTGLSNQAAYQPTQFGNQFTAPNAYSPTSFGNQFTAPTAYQAGQFDSGFQEPAAYQTGQFTNQFTAPTAYQAGQFSTGLGALGSVQDYMNPYMQNVTNVQATEARRQSDISRLADASRLTQAGAYGGSRQAIMEAEARRNLGTQIGTIQATGLQNSYANALKQRLEESAAGVNAQQLGEQSRQFGANQSMTAAQQAAQYGSAAQQAAEASRQFGASQGLSAAQFAAQQRLAAQQAGEASRQFGSNQAMTSADRAAQYGLSGLQATEASKQFGANQAMTAAQQAAQYGLAGQQATEASKQFGAKQGLDLLGAQLAAGTTQRTNEQQALDALKAQYDAQLSDPFKKVQFQQSLIQGLPVAAGTTSANTSNSTDLMKAIADILGLSKTPAATTP